MGRLLPAAAEEVEALLPLGAAPAAAAAAAVAKWDAWSRIGTCNNDGCETDPCACILLADMWLFCSESMLLLLLLLG